jgi:ribose-phosphate pyrophosphokinase
MIDTGTTLIMAARMLKENGASSVHALISHGSHFVLLIVWINQLTQSTLPVRFLGLLSEANMSIIEELPIEQLVV